MAKADLIEAPKYTIDQLKVMSHDELKQTLNPKEAETFDELSQHQTEQFSNELLQWWERGRKLHDVKKQAEQGKFYGSQIIEKYTFLLGYRAPNLIYACIRVASVWSTKEQFLKQIVNRQNGSFMLLWSHVVLIAGLADSNVRREWVDKTLEHEWDHRTLHTKLKEANLIQASNNDAGRTPSLPGSVPDALRNIRAMSSTLVRKATGSWIGERFNLVDELEKMPSQLVTPDLYTDVEKTLAELMNLGDKVADLINATVTSRDNLKQRLELHGQTVPTLTNGSAATVDGTFTGTEGDTDAKAEEPAVTAPPTKDTSMAVAKKTAKKAAPKAAAKKKAAKKSK